MIKQEIKDNELRDLITEMVIKSSFGRTLVYVLSKRTIIKNNDYKFPAAVGNNILIINLNKIKELAQKQRVNDYDLLAQIIFHECLHIAWGHLDRLPINRLSNWATDATINKLLPLLNREPFVTLKWLSKLIGEPLSEELSAEEIYLKLLSKIKYEKKQMPTAGEGGEEEQDEEDQNEGEQKEGKNGSSCKCPFKSKGKGNEKGGGKEKGDEKGDEQTNQGEPEQIDDHKQLKENSGALEKEEMKRDLKRGIEAEMAKNPGSLPGELAKILELLQKPSPKWRNLLKNIIGSAPSNANPSYSRVNKRDDGEIVKPGKKLKQEKIRVTIAIDTSGSLWTNETFYQRVIATFKKLIDEEIMEVAELIFFDTQITHVIKDWTAKKKVELKGSGGTNIEPVIEWMMGHPYFDVGIIVTDGYWATPKRWPKQKIVWIVENEEEEQIIKEIMRPDHRVVVFDEK